MAEPLPSKQKMRVRFSLPAAIVARYNKEINEIIRTTQIAEKLSKQGLTVAGGTPDLLGDFIAQDIVKWQKVVREAGIASE